MTVQLAGLSWGHRRANGPLGPLVDRFRQLQPQVAIDWQVRPLSDFEHQGIVGVAERFDLVIYDHPFSGDIEASGAFVPLDELVPELAPSRAADFVGPSLQAYRYRGRTYGAPIDGATQHALVRSDLMAGEALPSQWGEVLELGRRLRGKGLFLGFAGATPHAGLTVAALMANMGKAWSTDPAMPFAIDRSALIEALSLHASLLEFAPPESLAWSSIDLHDQMVDRDDIAYAPCVYGYATYGEADMRRPLSFAPFPGPTGTPAGTAVGGTALALSRRCVHAPEAVAFIRFCLSSEAQQEIIPAHHGQPALSAAWDRPDVDKRFNGFYSATRSTIDTAWVRPRLPGYLPFQREAGAVVRSALEGKATVGAAAKRILELAENVNRDLA